MAIIKKCAYYGTAIIVSPSKESANNFCNRDCYLAFHKAKNRKVHICEICGKEFSNNKTKNANRFCSRECYNKFHNIKNKERICPTCGKIFSAKTSEDIYCSQECYDADRHPPKGENHWNWKGGISVEQNERLTPEYSAWRRAVHKKCDYKCIKCGNKKDLVAHHIYSWKHYPKLRYEIDNGETLCKECHIALHSEFGFDTDEPLF